MARIRPLAATLTCILACASALASASPTLLIVQRRAEKEHDVDPNLEIGDFVAQELEDDGRVAPILWSQSDAIFRSMGVSGKAPRDVTTPTMEQAQKVADGMKIGYILVVEAHRAPGGALLTRAELYKDKVEIWHDPVEKLHLDERAFQRTLQSGTLTARQVADIEAAHGFRQLTVQDSDGLDAFNSLRSVAHTWSQLLDQGPFAKLAAAPRPATPDPLPGAVAALENVPPQLPPHADDAHVFADADAAAKDGRPGDAVGVLRDAIDAEPFDMPLRARLIKLLTAMNLPDLAAEEATRAASISPGGGGFRVESARALLAAGNLDAAAQAANEALVRAPDGADARIVLGEVALRRGDDEEALKQLDAALAAGPSAEASYYRALARAFGGDAPGALADLGAARAASGDLPLPSYASTMPILDQVVNGLCLALRDALPPLALGATQAQAAALAQLRERSAGCAALLDALARPELDKPSHERRALALKLLVQACSEAAACAVRHDDDVLTDARIDLGDAMKQYKAAGDLFTQESLPPPPTVSAQGTAAGGAGL